MRKCTSPVRAAQLECLDMIHPDLLFQLAESTTRDNLPQEPYIPNSRDFNKITMLPPPKNPVSAPTKHELAFGLHTAYSIYFKLLLCVQKRAIQPSHASTNLWCM